jgi:primase-polymerase (primpol)-like protein
LPLAGYYAPPAPDLDHCRDLKTGAIVPGAQRIVDELDSYTEVSPSGDGLHIWIRARLSAGIGNQVAIAAARRPRQPDSGLPRGDAKQPDA